MDLSSFFVRAFWIGFPLGLFFAYITIVAIWRIRPMSGGEVSSDPSKTRFGQTALAGFAGIVFSDLVAKFLPTDETAAFNVTYYYLISFITFFFLFLVGFAIVNAHMEGKRTEIMFGETHKGLRKLKWIVQIDTFLNLIRGRNQMRTEELVKETARYQEMIENVCAGICEFIKTMIRDSAKDANLDVRVSISVLSKDREHVAYIARDPLSYPAEFGRDSVAWFTVMLGEPRWYLSGWKDSEGHFLLDVKDESQVPKDFRDALGEPFKKRIPFRDFWMGRGEDYGGFLMIPIPLRKRYLHMRDDRGAIHISFKNKEDLKKVFSKKFIEKAEFSKPQLDQFSEQPLVQALEAISSALWPMIERYDAQKRAYGKLPSLSSELES